MNKVSLITIFLVAENAQLQQYWQNPSKKLVQLNSNHYRGAQGVLQQNVIEKLVDDQLHLAYKLFINKVKQINQRWCPEKNMFAHVSLTEARETLNSRQLRKL